MPIRGLMLLIFMVAACARMPAFRDHERRPAANATSCPEALDSLLRPGANFFESTLLPEDAWQRVERVFLTHWEQIASPLNPTQRRELEDIARAASAVEVLHGGPGVHGYYSFLRQEVLYLKGIKNTWHGLSILLHEFQHAADDVGDFGIRQWFTHPIWSQTRALELRAFRSQYRFLKDLFATMSTDEISRLGESSLRLNADEGAFYRAQIAFLKGEDANARSLIAGRSPRHFETLKMKTLSSHHDLVHTMEELFQMSESDWVRYRLTPYQPRIRREILRGLLAKTVIAAALSFGTYAGLNALLEDAASAP
jgi:hypothetical protein